MSISNLSGVGKLENNSHYNLMTIQAVRYGYNAVFSVLTKSTSIQGLYIEINEGNIKQRWVINHTNANENLSSPSHHKNINNPIRLEITTYGSTNIPAIRITGQTIAFNYDEGYLMNESSNPMYILPFGGDVTIYDTDVVSANILHIQELM